MKTIEEAEERARKHGLLIVPVRMSSTDGAPGIVRNYKIYRVISGRRIFLSSKITVAGVCEYVRKATTFKKQKTETLPPVL
jgi:hypothetical protein